MSKTIHTALLSAKQELGKVPKNSSNPFFKSKYFDINGLLEVVEPILHAHGLFVLQPIIDGSVVTQIIHAETGQMIQSSMKLSNIVDPQKQGSEVTYYRRYTLQSLLAMQADDDDGNAASKAPQKLPAKPELTPTHSKWIGAVKSLAEGMVTMEKIETAYSLSPINRELLISEAANA
jgi:hypothetical protein